MDEFSKFKVGQVKWDDNRYWVCTSVQPYSIEYKPGHWHSACVGYAGIGYLEAWFRMMFLRP